MGSETWKTLSLTHVEYIEGDDISFLLAIISQLPYLILISSVTLIIFRRDLHTILFVLGIFINESINYTLKHIIKEPRPMERNSNHVKYGMPSSHAQFMAFFSTYMAFFLYVRIHHNSSWRDNLWKHASLSFCNIMSLLVCISRVYLRYHTITQVMVGVGVGILTGTLWFSFVHLAATPYFPFIASWPISEYLMVRDLTPIPNILWFEYCTQRTECRTRMRKGNNKKTN